MTHKIHKEIVIILENQKFAKKGILKNKNSKFWLINGHHQISRDPPSVLNF